MPLHATTRVVALHTLFVSGENHWIWLDAYTTKHTLRLGLYLGKALILLSTLLQMFVVSCCAAVMDLLNSALKLTLVWLIRANSE